MNGKHFEIIIENVKTKNQTMAFFVTEDGIKYSICYSKS